jgi:hypothetical protein
MKNVSYKARQEILKSVCLKYAQSNKSAKTKLLEGFVAATGYDRKYAIKLLNRGIDVTPKKSNSGRRPVYNDEVKQILEMVWNAANQICSKRLTPFIPAMVEALERHGHLSITEAIRNRLTKISPATVDRILKQCKLKQHKGISTTSPGTLLKHQIKVRTFADWDNVQPGFFECDLVAHCGTSVCGTFLNTLVITDIATGWTECLPIPKKGVEDVKSGLVAAQKLLPFPILGIDVDNGSEFINYELLSFCKNNEITFTRSRAYRKNDQAHVEEKNGSIVRRLIGYDRYEGEKAWEALADLYAILRLYINFFQPSLKLKSKIRNGSRTIKKYEKAKTPYQRTLESEKVAQILKDKLAHQYHNLDPVYLKNEVSVYQKKFWSFAWQKPEEQNSSIVEPKLEENATSFYRTTKKTRKPVTSRNWRTRKDPFTEVNDEIELHLKLKPDLGAKAILDILLKEHPGQFKQSQLRTLQRRVSQWHAEQNLREKKYQERMVAKKDFPMLSLGVNM